MCLCILLDPTSPDQLGSSLGQCPCATEANCLTQTAQTQTSSVFETSIGKMSVMRWARAAGAELNSSVDGEYAQLVDETSGAVLPLEAEGLEGWK